LPYIQGDNSSIKNGRSSIVLLNVDQCHYETLGFEIENQNNKPKIKCRLPWNHPMIQKIVSFSNKTIETKDELRDNLFDEKVETSNENTEEEDDQITEDGEIENQNKTTVISDHEETEFSNSENDSDEEMNDDVSDASSHGNSSDEGD